MKNHRIIIAIISIAVSVVLGIILFNNPELVKVTTSNWEEITLTATQNFVKNIAVSMFCGGSIYTIFYAIPHEYKEAKQKRKGE